MTAPFDPRPDDPRDWDPDHETLAAMIDRTNPSKIQVNLLGTDITRPAGRSARCGLG